MLKRTTKKISLIVAMISVMTTVQVMAAEGSKGSGISSDATVSNTEIKTLETLEGTIENAKSYGKGAFLVDGYKSDNDETAIYYLTDDGTFKKIESDDIESGDTLGDKLQGRYAEIVDTSGNATYIDLQDGYKVIDDDIRETMVDNAATKLKKVMKKDDQDRFNKACYDNTIKANQLNSKTTSTIINGSTKLWSRYNYALNKSYSYINAKNYSTIYADTAGNYIDGDYNLGRITVSTEETTGASVAIENTDDIYEIKDNGITYDLRAEIKEDPTYINEQKDHFTRAAYLTIYKKVKGEPDSAYVPATNELYIGDDSNHRQKVTNDSSARVLQIFSKEPASDTIDGIKYSKDSDIYFMTDEKGERETLLGFGDKSKLSGAGTGLGAIQFNDDTGFVSAYIDKNNNRIYGEHFTPTKKNGYKYLDIDSYKETDIEGPQAYGASNGNLSCLSDGYLKFWNGKDFEKKYRVDGSFDNLSMNDKDSVIMWNEDKGVYAVLYNKAPEKGDANTSGNEVKTTTGAQVKTTTESQVGWVKNVDSSWSYIKHDGSKAVGWLQDPISSVWYYIDDKGIMVNNKWIKDNEKWYYLDSSGEMLSNTTVDGYILGSDGEWIQ